MQYRVDPATGTRISALGLGCMRFPGAVPGHPDPRTAEAIIARAVEEGINYLDTAYLYPGNESCVGTALERLALRDRVLLATKLPHGSCKRPEDFDRFFDEQLRRLRTERIDYYLIHNVTSPAQWERLQSLGIEGWIARQKAAGRIGSIGFSYHGSAGDFPVLLDAFDWDFCQIQYNYAGERYQAGTAGLKAAAARGLAVFVMEPLLGGRLAGKLPPAARRVFERAAGEGLGVLDGGARANGTSGDCASAEISPDGVIGVAARIPHDEAEVAASAFARTADERAAGASTPTAPLDTPAAWGLAWVWDHPEVTMLLSGMTSLEQVAQNARIASAALPGALSAAQYEVIGRVRAIFEAANRVPCTGCNYCMPCPQGINIPGCFAAYNASFVHGWFTGVAQYFTASAIRSGHPKLATNCVKCGACQRHCPQHIAIPDRLDDVRHRLTPGPVDAVLKLLARRDA